MKNRREFLRLLAAGIGVGFVLPGISHGQTVRPAAA
jgi:hypothetical protein